MSENYRLSIRDKNSYSLFLKTISLTLVISFLFQEVLQANPDPQAITAFFQKPAKILSLKFPPSVATVQDVFLAEPIRHQSLPAGQAGGGARLPDGAGVHQEWSKTL